jgi:predicted ATPase
MSCGEYVSVRPHISAYVSIRQHMSAYVSIRQHTSAYVSLRQHTSAYVSIRQHTRERRAGLVSVVACVTHAGREHTSAYASIRQHTSAYGRTFSERCRMRYTCWAREQHCLSPQSKARRMSLSRMLTYADVC